MKTTLKALFLGACLSVFFAVPAWATHGTGSPTTPGDVTEEVTSEVTPFIGELVLIVVAIFGLGLLAVLARKGARMARGAISRG